MKKLELRNIIKEEIQKILKESSYWKVDLSDFIKSNFRKLENQDNITDRDIENVVSSFISKYSHLKAEKNKIESEVKRYFSIDENVIKEDRAVTLKELEKFSSKFGNMIFELDDIIAKNPLSGLLKKARKTMYDTNKILDNYIDAYSDKDFRKKIK